MMRLSNAFFILSMFGVLASAACHPGPVLPAGKSNVGGTIAGIVSSVGKAPEPGRKVTATNVATGERFEAITGVNGGYTIKVPEGTYKARGRIADRRSADPAAWRNTGAEIRSRSATQLHHHDQGASVLMSRD